MNSHPIPNIVDDADRLSALMSYAILDTPTEWGFDDIVQLACHLCQVPVSLVSLVAGDRQWFKARVGFPHCETDLDSSICAHALAQPDAVLVIPDLTVDPRTRANPLVTGEPFIRFYAGAPLVTPDGHVLGSLCVIDKVVRPGGLTVAQAENLKALARQVVTQMELRRAVTSRDIARAEEQRAYQVREALRDSQARIAAAGGDLDAVLRAVVAGAISAVPAADGGVIALLDGDHLEYRAVLGSLAAHRGQRVPLAASGAGRCARTREPYLVRDAGSDPHVDRGLAGTLGLGSAALAPILGGDGVLGVLKLQSARTDAFTQGDLDIVGLFTSAATAGLTEASARAETCEKDDYWRGLFDRLSEGFVVGEVVRDERGRVIDWTYVEVNPAWGDLLGIDPKTVVGRSVREVIPDIEEEWIDEFAQVVETGEVANFTRRIETISRWYEGRAFRLDANRFGVIFLEVTQRVEAEDRRSALLTLGDRLRDLTTTADMTRAAAEIVGRTLGATRAGFGRIEGDVEAIEIEPDWTAPGIASIAGRHRFDDYGDLRGSLRRGEPLVIDDVATDPRTRDDPGPMRAIAVGALVNMPVRERGRTVAAFIVHDVKPRTWAGEELAFLRNVADRLEVGVARVRAEELQAVLNTELVHRLKNTLTVVQSIATQTLRSVTEREPVEAFERRVLALSRAHDVLMQKSWAAARMRSVMESVLGLQADLDRFALDGPDIDISPQAALSLTLLLHELATNALKYGALSAKAGSVRIAWRTEQGTAPTLVLDWTESGGPSVTAPNGRGGFGSKLIRMGLVGTRNADLEYGHSGLRAEFRAPLTDIQIPVH
ncbi:GAF domain-containing protein [Methylobacterium pseudosasicola]|uniref:Blue-light-activated histidine kinase n=1 Tax=Methylobacterium pseudosasicola TaxID=582667 RepID=A0A1I4SKX2_9HYPH|nr:GAF domain-containing protein [Methylobacterium pseudosasicola]SFM65064.1 Two-component sensor histidine kinase, contains HisKA and HATPase domains [Methylobacterium pseudosasicola]